MNSSTLNFTKIGQGHPLIILHGLYGSGSNWMSIAKKLSGFCEVYLVDQRNHGLSQHSNEHSYDAMMNDLISFMDEQGLKKAILLGHSMGGKTAIWTAINHPERISHLVVADISPLEYPLEEGARHHMQGHERIMKALLSLDLSKVNSFRDADQMLEADFPDKGLRQFLMKNLGKVEEGTYAWKLNLSGLLSNLSNLSKGIVPELISDEGYRQYPVLFIRGENSNYIQEEDEFGIKRIFPLAQIATIKNAGHWLHAEQPEIFIDMVKRFLFNS